MNELVATYLSRLSRLNLNFERSAISLLDEEHRLIGLKGARGTGKTTLLLQYARKQPEYRSSVLYATLDNFWFSTNKLYDLADAFAKQGGKLLLLDEVHKYPGWSRELKNIYDDLPELKVIFTGSSLLEILNARADLSRRAIVYELQGLSFREYLALAQGVDLPAINLQELLQGHQEFSESVLEKTKPLAHFRKYLEMGYYPFFKESEKLYHQKLEAVANLILEIELPLLRQLNIAYVAKLKQLLAILAQSVPFIPNMSKLSERIGINRTTLLQYVHYLQEAGLIFNLFKEGHGISQLQKPNKILMDNTNLSYLLAPDTDMGALRETFFANQLGHSHRLNFPAKGDFLVDGKYIFEVGGKNKDAKQIRGMANSFMAIDDIEFGSGQSIPLWAFGFLY